MADWKQTLLSPEGAIADAIKVIDDSAHQICLIVDDEQRLLGTITDGDVRRAILKSIDLGSAVGRIMNARPHVADPSTPAEALLRTMTTELIRQIPLIDGDRRVVGLTHIDDLLSPERERDSWVVLMAGGLGTRLRPLTRETPKPLLPVGDKPLLEIIIERFIEQHFRRFYISVNYKAEMIKGHFGDGARWGAEIRYIEEEERLGTAGSLRLIPERGRSPLIVMNGDLVTRINFQSLLDYHAEQASCATMCVREYDFRVPFGVVEVEEHRIKRINEKPLQSFLVNAGIYVLEPDLLDFIPEGEAHDMTTLFERIVADGRDTAVFPIREYWLDVGRLDDFSQANAEIHGKET